MKLLKSVFFCLIGVAIFFQIQNVMISDGPDFEHEERVLKGEKAIPKDMLDVIFLGTSLMDQGMSPMELYENTGILSYNMATSGQPIQHSYYFLKQAFKRQSPKVVVLDVSSLFLDEYDSHWRYGLDNMEFSMDKIEMALEYEKVVDGGDRWSALFPILKYHTRWSQLTKDNFETRTTKNYYSAGQYLFSLVQPFARKTEEIDAIVDHLLTMDPGYIKYIEDGEICEESITGPVYSVEIQENRLQYLLKIKNLCEEKNSQLLLVRIPTFRLPQIYSSTWTKQKYLFTKSLAEEYGIPFFDLTYDIDIGLDLATDTSDGGIHPTNIRGAKKITKALSDYMIQNYDLGRKKNSEYDNALIKYKKVREVALLQSETRFDTYIERLIENKDKWTIIIASYDEHKRGLDEANYQAFDLLGLRLCAEGSYGVSYGAIIEQGTVKYEATSDRRINYSTQLENIYINLTSSGWFTAPKASITINGEEYAVNKRGLNLVVYDNESGLVIDSVCFDTYQASKPASRNAGNINNYLRTYESAVCYE